MENFANSLIRALAILPIIASAISVFVGIMLALLAVSLSQKDINRNTIVYGSVMFFFVSIFFAFRAAGFSVSATNFAENESLLLDLDRLIRGSPILLFIAALVFIRSFFSETHHKTLTTFIMFMSFLIAIITITTDLVLVAPLTTGGAYGTLRASDHHGFWSNLYFIGTGGLIVWTLFELFRNYKRYYGKLMLLGYIAILTGGGIDLFFLGLTATNETAIQFPPSMDIGAIIFAVLISYILINRYLRLPRTQ